MPGSSLWLVPPKSSPVSNVLSTLINQIIPSRFPDLNPPRFAPHITLTSDLPASDTIKNPKQWLNHLPLPSSSSGGGPDKEIDVHFELLQNGKEYFKKLTLRVQKNEPLVDLAVACRAATVENGDRGKAEQWAREQWTPHCSLLYADIDISEKKREEMEGVLMGGGISLPTVGDEDAKGGVSGWTGGSIWLVPTDRDITEWLPLAEREL